MRPNTLVWVKFESKAKPDFTKIEQLSIAQIPVAFLNWILETPMGHKIVMTLARTESELLSDNAKGIVADDVAIVLAEYERIHGAVTEVKD